MKVIKVNNKGQSLIVFVLLLPIIVLLIAIVADLGNLQVTKKKYENQIKNTINYGLKHLSDENINQKLNDLLNANIDANNNIIIKNNLIQITVTSKEKSIFNQIIKKTYDINLTYTGYIEDSNIKIKKE